MGPWAHGAQVPFKRPLSAFKALWGPWAQVPSRAFKALWAKCPQVPSRPYGPYGPMGPI